MSTILFRITDEAGAASNLAIEVQDGLTLAQYTSYAAAVFPQVQALSAGRVEEVSLKAVLVVAGVPEATADADSIIENKALFVFRDSEGFVKRMTIPAVDMAQVGSDHVVNTGVGSAGEQFITDIVTGDGTVIPQTIHGNDITQFVQARLYVARDRA